MMKINELSISDIKAAFDFGTLFIETLEKAKKAGYDVGSKINEYNAKQMVLFEELKKRYNNLK